MQSPNKNIIEENGIKILQTDEVFYNTAQIFNRNVSIEIINAYLKYMNELDLLKNHKSFSILECMSASGIRSLRYITELNRNELENKNIKFFINDMSKVAVNLIKYNLKLNNIEESENTKIMQHDCRELMMREKCKYNIIDIDPFGSSIPFLQSAFNAIKHNGLLLITCTDTAVLCSNPIKCYVKYGNILPKFIAGGFKSKGSKTLGDKNIQNGTLDRARCHSMSLKILLNTVSRMASIEGCAIEPLISISVDYYVRVAVRVIKNPADVRRSFTKNENIGFCINCGGYKTIPFNTISNLENNELCSINVQNLLMPIPLQTELKCKYRICGPFWTDKIQNTEFLKILNKSVNKGSKCPRLKCFIKTIYEESLIKDITLFDYSIPTLCSYMGMDCIPIYNFLSKLKNLKYEVAVSHYTLNGFVSNAPFKEIIKVLHEFIELTKNIDKKKFLKEDLNWNNKSIKELLENSINRRLLFGKEGPMKSPKKV